MACRWKLVSVSLLLAASTQTGCNSCERTKGGKRHRAEQASADCSTATDCFDLDACEEAECVDAHCRHHALAAGTPCGEATACQTEPRCDGQGVCVAGEPVGVDDGNPCTTDACDPVRGVTNEPVDIDDGDACTTDTCDRATGEVTHEPVDLDDGDECTFDTCNPETGISHARPEPRYTCAVSCGAGYHAASRRPNPGCPDGVLQSWCQPDCGPSFYTCENACPPGYRAGTRHASAQCGPEQPLTFCEQSTVAR